MKKLFVPIFLNTIKMKSVWLYWIFGLIPFVVMIAMSINSNFLQISGEKGTLSALEFFSMVFGILHNLIIPSIVLAFIVSKLFYEELHSGIIFMYKDINRNSILNSKWLSLFLVQLIFLFILFLSSIIVYFVYLKGFDFSSGQFLPISKYLATTLVPTLTLYLVEILTINFAILISLYLSTGFTIVATLVFLFFITIGSMLNTAKYVIPTGYDDSITKLGGGIVALISLTIFFVYFIVTYIFIIKKHKNIEY